MADAITIKALQDASLDAKSLEEVINGSESKQVTTRKGETYPSVKKALKELFANGGLPATTFNTRVLMESSSLEVGSYAMVLSDGDNNGYYEKTESGWVNVPLNMFTGITKHNMYTDIICAILNAVKVHIMPAKDWVTDISSDGKTAKMSIRNIQAPYRDVVSGMAILKPNTEYVILKTKSTDRFRAALFDDYPENITTRIEDNSGYSRPMGGRVIVYDNIDTGMVGFKTSNSEVLLGVTTSLRTISDEKITVLEVNSPEYNSKTPPKNLYNPEWCLTDISVSDKGGFTHFRYEEVNHGINNLITYYMPVLPDTQYTISKEESERFYIAEVVPEYVDDTFRRVLRPIYKNDSAITHTFTTSSDALFLAVYVSNTGAKPRLQLELGDTATEFVEYVDKLDNYNPVTGGLMPVSSSNFTRISTDNSRIMSEELQEAIDNAESSVLYLESGTYLLDKTIVVPSNTKLIGLGDVSLVFADQDGVRQIPWRGNSTKVYLMTEEDSKNIHLENIKVIGRPNLEKRKHWGICLQGSGHVLNDVSVYDINWIGGESLQSSSGGHAWGLAVYKAENCRINGGRFEDSGYENVGIEESDNIIFNGIYCGTGWRTSFQVHRNSSNIVLTDSTIIQTSSSLRETHAAVTLHGIKDNLVRDVKIVNCTIDAQISPNQTKPCGAIQAVNGGEHNITISNCDITTNNYGVSAVSDVVLDTPTNWVIANNRINSTNNPVKYIGLGGVIANNIFITDKEIVYGSSNQQTVTVANNNIVTPI